MQRSGDFFGGGVLMLHPVFAHPAHPSFAAIAHEAACAPIVLAGPAVEAVRALLAEGADAIDAAGGPTGDWLHLFRDRRAG